MEFPTLMGSIGGWVFLLDVTTELKRRKFHIRVGTYLRYKVKYYYLYTHNKAMERFAKKVTS